MPESSLAGGAPRKRLAALALPPGRMLSTAEAAAFLNLAPITLRAMRVKGAGPAFVKLTERRVGYRLADLEAWLTTRPTYTTTAQTKADQRRASVAAAR